MTQAENLRRVSRRSRVVCDAYIAGKLTSDELDEWLAELRKPKGFWAKVSWYLFDI